MIRKLLDGLVTALLVSTAALPAMAQGAPEKPLVLAFPSLGREIFTPLDGTASELFFAGAMMEFLVYRGLGDDNKLYPGLAESWDVSPDGLTYTFKLRKGVQFHAGRGEMTAEDVLYTFDLIASEKSRNPRKFVVGWIAKKEAVDPYTVRMTLKSPQPSFLHQLSSFNPYFMIISKKHFEELGVDEANRRPVGTGPYALKRHARSEVVELEAVQNHWRKTPEFARVDVRIIPEERTLISMLKANEADLIFISGSSVNELKRDGVRILSNPGAYFINVVMGGQVLPTREGYDKTSPWAGEDAEKSKKVRRALCLAINTPEIIDRVLQGTARTYAVNQYLPAGTFTRDEWKPYPYDPAEAKKLLAEAGYANGFPRPITMLVIPSHGVEMADVPEAVAMYWERLGLRVNRRVVDDAVWKNGWYPRSAMQKWTTYIQPSTPLFDPADWYKLATHTDSAINQLFETPEISKLVDQALVETDAAKATELRHKVGDIIYDNYMVCPVALKDAIYASSARVTGWQMNSGVRFPHNLEYIVRAK